jgi:molybdenum cofactor cytidylyltransferase
MSGVAAILLAAGESRRWGADNKLLAPIGGKPMVRRTAEMILASSIRPVLIVTGHEAGGIRGALNGLSLSFHHAPDFAEGMAASLRTGIGALPMDCEGVLVCLGDMPFLRSDTLDQLAVFHSGEAAVFPTYTGKRGNPVLLARSLFAEILKLTGDEGARTILRVIPDQVAELPVDDPGILRDVDLPDALRDTL